MVSASDPTVCGSTSFSHSTKTYCLNQVTSHIGWNFMPSACKEVTCSTTGFSESVSRLQAASKRSSTNSMYDDRWFHFIGWAAEQGIDPLCHTAALKASFSVLTFQDLWSCSSNSKSYGSYLALVLSCTARAKLVHD